MPGPRVIPPPCRRCGRVDGYYSAGLCDLCHRHAPQFATGCRDCHAWGVFRTTQWLCVACVHWRKHHPVGDCGVCGMTVAVNDENACRLCWRVFLDDGGRKGTTSLEEANRPGQQLFLANGHHSNAGRVKGARRERTRTATARELSRADTHFRLAAYSQLVLFDADRDLRHGRAQGFAEPADSQMASYLEQFLIAHAARHGWSNTAFKTTLQGLKIVLSLQDTPGARLRATEILQLHQINLTTLRLLEVCKAADVLDDDRTPAFDDWFADTIAELPMPMRAEVGRWRTVMIDGRATPPRRRPRSKTTTRVYLRWCMPALRHWAVEGHESLREISRDDVIDVLPESGNPRAAMGQGLRCLFRVLKSDRIVFVNPLTGLATGTHSRRHPVPLPAVIIREGLNSSDPATAAAVALTAFHALRSGDLRTIRLTDIYSGRLHLGSRIIPLAEPVRVRIQAWLAERERRWPHSMNPHLFVSKRTAIRVEPVGVEWFTQRLGLTAQAIREDRILDELHANGDIRRICDLFGLSISGAVRYQSAIEHPDLTHFSP